MKKVLTLLSVITLMISSCGSGEEANTTDPLESGRGFIEASLKGNYVQAKKYLLQDSTNIEYFDGLKDFNSKISREDQAGYSNANIIIDSSIAQSDSVNIIYYSNSYKNKPSKIKVIKHNNQWLVDFKYTFTGGNE
ncbi:MAG: hypothetical protein ABI237_05755 [Ginsengibacter sp.]